MTSSLYSLTARFNYILYNCMGAMMICGVINHLQMRYGHLVGLSATPIGLTEDNIKF